MLDLIIGIDGVQRRTRRALERPDRAARNRPLALLRATAAVRLRTLADRIEPIGVGAVPAPRRS